MRAWLAVLGALMISGCTGDPGSTVRVSYETPIHVYEPQFSDETGALVVMVLDESIQPVAGAIVGLVASGQEAVTSALGEAGFDYLTPGSYEVIVDAKDFAQSQRIINVEAGVVSKVRVTLERIPSKEPYIFHTERAGTWQCGYGTFLHRAGQDSCAGIVRPADPAWETGVRMNWTAGVLEARAPPVSSFSPRTISAAFWMNGTGVQERQCILRVNGPASGLRLEFQANQEITPDLVCEGTAGVGNSKATRIPPGPNPSWSISMRPYSSGNVTELYVFVDQRYNAWLAVFVNQGMPEGYTSLPDS